MQDTEPRFVQSTSVIATDVGNSAVVMTDTDLSSYFGLDDVGAVVWKELAEPKTISELVDILVALYDVEAEQCQREAVVFIQAMLAKGLVDQPLLAIGS